MSRRLYWGDLHSHCSISYGHGTVSQALQRARQQLDFCSVTGHAFWPDMPTNRQRYASIIDYHNEGFARLAGNWPELIRSQRELSVAGEFLAFPSYEWHSMQYGDHNVYAAGPELDLLDAGDLPGLRRTLDAAGQAAIAIPHHIGYRQGFRGINWDAFSPSHSPFVEVISLHGCSLSEEAPFPMLHDMGPRDGRSLAEHGWARGHRFGIVGGTDHHAAYPGSHGDGRMGVFAERLTRASLWEAFLARRVYAATGDAIDARMFLNDAWIGEVVHAPGSRCIRVDVQGMDAIRQVSVLRNGRLIRQFHSERPQRSDSGRYMLRLTWGWGRQNEVAEWSGQMRLLGGEIVSAKPCFSGQSIVAPDSGEVLLDTTDLPHAILSQDERQLEWRSITTGNRTMRHPTTQSLALELQGNEHTLLELHVNGQEWRHTVGELLEGSRSHFLRGWLSEAIRIGPCRPREQCVVHAEFRDQGETHDDVYRVEVEQSNGEWAWLTPVWAER